MYEDRLHKFTIYTGKNSSLCNRLIDHMTGNKTKAKSLKGKKYIKLIGLYKDSNGFRLNLENKITET